MRNALVWFLSIGLLPSVVLYATTTATAGPRQDGSPVAQDGEDRYWEPPEEPADEPAPPPAPPDDRPRPPRAREQRQPPAPPPGAPEQRGRFGPGLDPIRRQRAHRFGLMERLLPLIAERRPDLAERLKRLRERSPEEFRRVLVDALAMRLEEALERGEPRFFGRGGPPRGPRPLARLAGPKSGEREREMHGQNRALEREAGELHRRNEELERRSHELAQRFRELRERRDPELEPERDEVRHLIAQTVEEHFNVRTELRRIELRRVEMELDRLREMVERIRHDLERREDARGPIIERRLRQLLGEEHEGW